MKTQSLTIYLLREHVRDLIQIIKPDIAIYQHDLAIDEHTSFPLFVRIGQPDIPAWTELFDEYLDRRRVFGETRSNSAVLLVPVSNRIVALTFGQGRFMLTDDCWEERFGLKVVLNSVGEGRLRSIDKNTFDAIPKHSREQTSRNASAFDFTLDVERDLVRAVTGALDDKVLGSMLTGMDALRTHLRVELHEIQGPLALYVAKGQEEKYKDHFPWVDYLTDVRSSITVEILDLELVDRLQKRNFERLWLAAPELVEWPAIRGFRYRGAHSAPEHNDIHLETFLGTLDEPVTREILTQRKIYCVGDDDRVKESWQVYRCLYCEIDNGDESFLLSGGKWYQVARTFVEEVNRSFNRISRIDLSWPEYDDDSEGAYLQRVQQGRRPDYALMDQRMVLHGPLGSKIEFCDIFTKENDLIHVKRYGNAGVLSHLFAQGSVSGDLLFTDPEFRAKVRALLPVSHLDQVPVERPSPDKYRIVYAIVSQSEKPLSVPFFSRLSLRQAVKRLEGIGYRVALAKINVGETRRKRKLVRKRLSGRQMKS